MGTSTNTSTNSSRNSTAQGALTDPMIDTLEDFKHGSDSRYSYAESYRIMGYYLLIILSVIGALLFLHPFVDLIFHKSCDVDTHFSGFDFVRTDQLRTIDEQYTYDVAPILL